MLEYMVNFFTQKFNIKRDVSVLFLYNVYKLNKLDDLIKNYRNFESFEEMKEYYLGGKQNEL